VAATAVAAWATKFPGLALHWRVADMAFRRGAEAWSSLLIYAQNKKADLLQEDRLSKVGEVTGSEIPPPPRGDLV
jgi:hypothetical protein